MKREDYIVIQSYMVSDLKLSGNRLIIYALINGFTKDGNHEFRGSLNYISEWTNLSRNTVLSTLKSLVDDGLIVKREYKENNVKFCTYKTLGSAEIAPLVQFAEGGSAEIAPLVQFFGGGSAKIEPNNINKIYIKDKENYKEDKSSSKKKEKGYTEDFEKAWEMYKRKGSKMNAFKRWNQLSESDKEKAFIHIPFYIKSNDIHFLKDFEGYLNNRYFNNVVYGKNGSVLFDPERETSTVYRPVTGGPFLWNDYYKKYLHVGYFDGTIYDGYSDDDRPDGAIVMLNNGRGDIRWSSERKTWEKV